MSIATVMPWVFPQFLDDEGIPVSYGKLYSYEAGLATPQPLYTDPGLSVAYTNPIQLDAAGCTSGPVYFLTSPAYKLWLKDANDVSVRGPYDFIIGSAPSA